MYLNQTIDIGSIKTLYTIFACKLTELEVVGEKKFRVNAVQYIVCQTAVIQMLAEALSLRQYIIYMYVIFTSEVTQKTIIKCKGLLERERERERGNKAKTSTIFA